MNKADMRKLEILDECLSQIQTGAASISDCLEAYPQYAQFLREQLSIALEARELIAPPNPSEEFVSRAKIRLMNQIQAQRSQMDQKRKKKSRRVLGFLRPAYVYAALVISFILLVSGLGMLSASASTLPGDSLYKVKLGVEETRLALSHDPVSDAELLLQFADTRLEEVLELTQASRHEDVPLALMGYDDVVSRIIDLANQGQLNDEVEILNQVHFGLEHHQEVLRGIHDKVPASGKKGIENAMERSGHGKDVIEKIKDEGESPSDFAPGQQNKDEKEDKQNQGNPQNQGLGRDPDRTPGPPPTKTPKPKNN